MILSLEQEMTDAERVTDKDGSTKYWTMVRARLLPLHRLLHMRAQ